MMTVNVKRLTPNQQQRRDRILAATRELVACHGYEGMIMRDVATIAKVSPTTLYNLYNTKDELLLAALRERVTEGWLRAMDEVPQLGMYRMLEQLRQSLQQTREEPAYARAITQALYRSGKSDEIIDVLVISTSREIQASLDAMLDAGDIKPNTDTTTLSRTLISTLWSNYFLWSNGIHAMDELETELKRAYLSMLLGVGTPTLIANLRRQIDSLDQAE